MKTAMIATGLLTLGLVNGHTEDFSRKGKIEMYALAQYNGGDSTTSSGGTQQIEIDSFITGGIGMGYHFHDHFALSLDLSFGSATVKGAAPGVGVESDSFASLANVSLEYNILKSRFTPVLAGGVGFINYTGDFGSSSSSFQETDLSYGAGGGVRWDVSDHLSFRAIYRAVFTTLQDTNDSLLFHTVTLSIGYAF